MAGKRQRVPPRPAGLLTTGFPADPCSREKTPKGHLANDVWNSSRVHKRCEASCQAKTAKKRRTTHHDRLTGGCAVGPMLPCGAFTVRECRAKPGVVQVRKLTGPFMRLIRR